MDTITYTCKLFDNVSGNWWNQNKEQSLQKKGKFNEYLRWRQSNKKNYASSKMKLKKIWQISDFNWGCRGRDHMIVGFITICTISAYHHWRCEFEFHSWRGVLDATLCDKVCQWLAISRWFYPGTPVSPANKSDHHDITEILLEMALTTITSLTLILIRLRGGSPCCFILLIYVTCINNNFWDE
jgi:hypothetical protein